MASSAKSEHASVDVSNQAETPGAVAPFPADDFSRDVWAVAGLPVDALDIDRAVARIDEAVRTQTRLSFVTPNVNWLVRARRDAAARREILNADMSLADGAPVVALAKAQGAPIRTRVAGSDIFEALRRRPGFAGAKIRVFFFGGRDGAAEAAHNALLKDGGGLEAAGFINPGFGDVEAMSSDEMIRQINAANPDFIVVALGAAKGQAWIDRNKDRLRAPVIAHLGAVVDFTAGGIARAPSWVGAAGLEWLWRVKEEPSLWRRYFDDGAALIAMALKNGADIFKGAVGDASGGVADVDFERNDKGVLLRLRGDLTTGSLSAIREAFRRAARAGGDVTLDFGDVGAFDAAFLGLVLLLEKHVTGRGARLFVSNMTRRQERFLWRHEMRYAAIAQDDTNTDAAKAGINHAESAAV